MEDTKLDPLNIIIIQDIEGDKFEYFSEMEGTKTRSLKLINDKNIDIAKDFSYLLCESLDYIEQYYDIFSGLFIELHDFVDKKEEEICMLRSKRGTK